MWLPASRREDGLLEHFAWLAEIRDRLDSPEDWWTYTNRSGPLMGLWREEFQHPGRDVFVEFVCGQERRILCLKIGGGSGDLRTAAAEAWSRVEAHGWAPPSRRPAAKAGTCTAALLDMSGLSAEAAAERVRQAIGEVGGTTLPASSA